MVKYYCDVCGCEVLGHPTVDRTRSARVGEKKIDVTFAVTVNGSCNSPDAIICDPCLTDAFALACSPTRCTPKLKE